MLKNKNKVRLLLSLGIICCSFNSFNINSKAYTLPKKTVNDYNVYKPVDMISDEKTNEKSLDNPKIKKVIKETSIEDYTITSSLDDNTDYSVNDIQKYVLSKFSPDVLTNKVFEDKYTVSENGSITLENNMEVTKKLLNCNYSVGETLVPEYIIIHDTGNRSEGADAMAHYNYWTSGNSEKTSAHYVVDDNTVMQLLEDNQVGWHTGLLFTDTPEVPQAKNHNSIGIELCVNEDGDFMETMKNGIALTKYLMDKYDIPPERVITHYQSAGKICPAMMIKDNPSLWKLFKAEITLSNSKNNIKDTLAMP